MKNLFLLLLIIASFLSCEKEDTGPMGTVTFYRTFQGPWNLIVDGKDRGYVEQQFVAPACDHPQHLTIDLEVGTHLYELKHNEIFFYGKELYFEVKEGCQVQQVVQ